MFAGTALSVHLFVCAGLSLFIIYGPYLYVVVCVLYTYNLTIGSVKHSFIEAQYYFGLNSIEIEYELHYAHSLLAIPHHQLKDNSKFNANFKLNMKYDC